MSESLTNLSYSTTKHNALKNDHDINHEWYESYPSTLYTSEHDKQENLLFNLLSNSNRAIELFIEFRFAGEYEPPSRTSCWVKFVELSLLG